MKQLLGLALVLFSAVPASAQQPRDLVDANNLARQQQRDLELALGAVRETQLALRTLTTVQGTLLGASGTIPLDKGVQIIDDYGRDVVHRRSYLPRDVDAIVTRGRRMLDEARTGPAPGDLQPLRDRFHHVVVAALERRVLQDAEQLTSLAQAYEQIASQLRTLQSHAIPLASAASNEPGKAVN
jgi:hypothetical protein